MQKNIWVRTAVAAAMLAGSGATMAEVTGNVTLASDYVFDGISQTDNGPALQGAIDWAGDSGLYVGAWASNVDFGEGSESDFEIDLYAGLTFGGEALLFDVGVVQYIYQPDGDDIDYMEVYGGVTFSENLTIKYWYTDDYANLGFASQRIKGTFSIPVGENWSVPLEYTFTDPEEGDSYNHYKVGLATAFGDVNAELSYQMTDIDDGGDEDFADIVYSDGGLVLTLGIDF